MDAAETVVHHAYEHMVSFILFDPQNTAWQTKFYQQYIFTILLIVLHSDTNVIESINII